MKNEKCSLSQKVAGGGVEERVLNRWDIQIEDFVTLFAVIRLS